MKGGEKKMKQFYNINEFAKRLGVSSSTLRNWDKSGALTPHHRTAGGHRVYSEEQAVHYLAQSKTEDKHVSFVINNGCIMDCDGLDTLNMTEVDMLIRFIGVSCALEK